VTVTATAPSATDPEPWQLRLFSKTLKKKQKVALLLDHLGRPDPNDRVLLLTNGDNNGAMNWRFRQRPARWTWGEFEAASIPEMQAFLGEPVVHVSPERLPFEDGFFDTVIVIDVHEHLEDPAPLNAEILRVVRPGGRAIVTVPNGDARRPAMLVKRALGMTKEVYGHVRDGYTIPELTRMLAGAGFRPVRSSSYSRFFTEMVELALNVAYVKVLSRKSAREAGDGGGHAPIAPSSADQMRKVEKTLKMYGAIYPFCRAVTALDDLLLPFTTGYAVTVEFEKPAGSGARGASPAGPGPAPR
jgi:SAM-dependent methyltransferase